MYSFIDSRYVGAVDDSDFIYIKSELSPVDISYIEDTEDSFVSLNTQEEYYASNIDEYTNESTNEHTNSMKIILPRELVESVIKSDSIPKSTIYDRIKSTPRNVVKSPMSIKKESKKPKVVIKKRQYRKGVKVSRELTDAQLKCLNKDQACLRKLCETIYNYFSLHSVNGMCPDSFIRKVARDCFTFDTFEMVIYLPTGTLFVSKLVSDPYIELNCKCGIFRRSLSDFIVCNNTHE
ncbi:hypothetical protein E24_00419 [Faustovirus]|nr:hypothetical protein PRJ_Fausto_00395 [Faustovirus]AMN83333.1 hypothetical protein E24_00419 [Faustovirus]AMN84317.1 hypothetical protein D5a_00417 [Faustovirus]AMN85303.1 hypothetical protein E23_00419 [Faustovirus]QBR99300.1 hypothetical protein [Faustovirus mariensis]